jgi:hypothetical protein
MRVEVEVICALHPRDEIEAALRAAGKQLASRADSVSVQVREGRRLTGILEFEMRRAAQYKVVDGIYATVKLWTWAFREDITIRFPKD